MACLRKHLLRDKAYNLHLTPTNLYISEVFASNLLSQRICPIPNIIYYSV